MLTQLPSPRVCLFLPITSLGVVFPWVKLSRDQFTSLSTHERKTVKPSSTWEDLPSKARCMITGIFYSVYFLNQEWRRILGSSRCSSVDPKIQPCLSDSRLITALLLCIGRFRSRSPVYVEGLLKHYRLLPRGKKFISAGFFFFLVDVQKSGSGEPK